MKNDQGCLIYQLEDGRWGDIFKPPAGLRTNLTIGQAAPAQPVNRTFARKSTRGVSRAAQADSGRKSPELSLAKAAAFLEGKASAATEINSACPETPDGDSPDRISLSTDFYGKAVALWRC